MYQPTVFTLLTAFLLTSTSLASPATSTEIIAATVTVTQAASTSPESPSYTDPTSFKTSILNSTNFYRYEHSASFVYWNDSLASYAQNWAKKCKWEHSHGPNGENLAQGYVDTTAAVDAWGNERALYSWKGSQTGFSEATGHFTQLVWKGTTSVGCAAVDCAGKNNVGGVLLVCEYWPAGNIVGDNDQFFEQNVGKQANTGQGFDEASATNPPTMTASSTGSTASATASATGSEMGSEASSMRRGLWAVAATVAALALAISMC